MNLSICKSKAELRILFGHHSIRNDSVQISDGYKTQVGEKLCGSLQDLQSNSVRVKGASAYVKFTSDSIGAKSGFKATYKASGKRASKFLKLIIR
jgi:hypothetical protein